MSFMTKNSLPVRHSSVVTLLRVEYQREYASIYAFGSDGARRVAKVHNFETVQLARDLYRKSKDLIGSKVIFNAAGGNDPSRWFFSIDEVLEDPADIERELIADDDLSDEELGMPYKDAISHIKPSEFFDLGSVGYDAPVQETSRVERLESIAAIWAKGDKLIAERNELALTLRRRLGSRLLRGDVLNADQMAALKVACD